MPRFEVGQIIHHRRYDYRGVVAAIDDACDAPEDWYQSNPTQPDRHQPWYHVLVNGGAETYVAEENLELDPLGAEIQHPYLNKIFSLYMTGRYYIACPN